MTKEEALILLQEHFSEGMVRTIMDSLKQEQGEPVCDECGVSGGYALYCLVCAEKFFSKYKEWVSLTDEDMEFLFPHGKSAWLTETLKVFEAKLKEKNH